MNEAEFNKREIKFIEWIKNFERKRNLIGICLIIGWGIPIIFSWLYIQKLLRLFNYPSQNFFSIVFQSINFK